MWQLGDRLARIVSWKGPRLRLVPGHSLRLACRGANRAGFSLTPKRPTPRQPWRGAEQKRESLSGPEAVPQSPRLASHGEARSKRERACRRAVVAPQTPPRAAMRGPENALRPCSRDLSPPDPAPRRSFGATSISCARSASSRSNFLGAASGLGAVPRVSRRALGNASTPVRFVGHWPHAQAGLPDAASRSLLHTSRRADESRLPPAQGSRRRHRNRVGLLVS